MRTQMVEPMQEDYIRTARGKGLSERKLAYKHGLRAALPPLIVVLGLDLDLPIVLGVTLFAGFFVLFLNLVADVVYALTDPKVVLS